MNSSSVLSLLQQHQAFDAHEQQMLDRLTEFVRTHENFHSRELLIGHATASAWIVDETQSHVLLLHHGKLNKWLQPGGHIENDSDIVAAAVREAREETGVDVRPLSEKIFDVDIHEIPTRPNEPAHFHYDLRFLLVADKSQPLLVSSESKDLAWVALSEIETLTQEESVLRMARKTRKGKVQPTFYSKEKSLRPASDEEKQKFQEDIFAYMTQDCFPHLSIQFRGDLRMFAFLIGNGTLLINEWSEELSDIDYRYLLNQKNEMLGILFTLFVNSWHSRKSDSEKNYSGYRAEQFLANKIDSSYEISPPLEPQEFAIENTNEKWKTSINKFALSLGNGTLAPDLLAQVEYLDVLTSEPSFIESVFAIFSNVLLISKNGEAENYEQAAFRAAQHIKEFCVHGYDVAPPFQAWETELH